MPLHRTFSGLTRDFNRLTKQNEQLQHEKDEALEAAQEVKTKNKRLKKALQKGQYIIQCFLLRVMTHLLHVSKPLLIPSMVAAEKQQRVESPIEKLIPRPNGQAGRKTTIDHNGHTRQGFNLCTEMGLDGPNDKKTYNEFRVSQSTTFRLILTTC
jgi:FtsZ-binding cell division protein ZapB